MIECSEPLSATEILARFILSKKWIRGDGAGIKQDAFIPHPHNELSVTRHFGIDEARLWQIGMEVARRRDKSLHGRADIAAALAASAGLLACADALDDNPQHAKVIGWPAEKEKQKLIAGELAASAVFQPSR
jgi:hypothetical protein